MAPRSGRVNPQVQTRGAARSFVQNLDTYYRPAQDTRRQNALQNALSQYSNMFEKRAAEVQEERRQGFYQQGHLDAMREQAGQELKGVREGNIFRQNSRFYEMGLNEGRGSIAGIEFQENLEKAWQESGIGFADEATFSQWLDGHAATFLGQFEGNQYALEAAMPKVQQGAESFAKNWAKRKNAAIAAERAAIFEKEFMHIVGSNQGAPMDDAVMQQQLYDLREEYFASDGPVANKRFVEAAIKWARITDDPSVMGAILRNSGPGGFNLGLDEYEDLEIAMEQTEKRVAASAAARQAEEEAQRQAWRDSVVGSVTDDLINNPYTNVLGIYEQVVEQNGGMQDLELLEALNAAQAAVQKSNTQSQLPEGVQKFSFYLELQQAPSWKEKMGVIGKYAEVLGNQVTTYMDQINPTKGYEMWIKNPQNKAEFDSYVDGLQLLENTEYDYMMEGQQGAISITGEAYLRGNIHRVRSENPDMTDRQVLQEAGKLTGEQLWREFGKNEVFVENLRNNPQIANMLQLTLPARNDAVTSQADVAIKRAELLELERKERMASMYDEQVAEDEAAAKAAEEAQAVEEEVQREDTNQQDFWAPAMDKFKRMSEEIAKSPEEVQIDLKMEAIDLRIEELKAADERLRRGLGSGRSVLTEGRLNDIAEEIAALEQQKAALVTTSR